MIEHQYSHDFYDYIDAGSRRSARAVAGLLLPEMKIASLLDIGAGHGAWAAEWLAAGVKDVHTFENEYFPGMGIHEMGTARMGRDPKTSVLNAHNQVWDAPNVFVTDGACMASTACQNPSLTYMALTARAADFAVNELNRRNL